MKHEERIRQEQETLRSYQGDFVASNPQSNSIDLTGDDDDEPPRPPSTSAPFAALAPPSRSRLPPSHQQHPSLVHSTSTSTSNRPPSHHTTAFKSGLGPARVNGSNPPLPIGPKTFQSRNEVTSSDRYAPVQGRNQSNASSSSNSSVFYKNPIRTHVGNPASSSSFQRTTPAWYQPSPVLVPSQPADLPAQYASSVAVRRNTTPRPSVEPRLGRPQLNANSTPLGPQYNSNWTNAPPNLRRQTAVEHEPACSPNQQSGVDPQESYNRKWLSRQPEQSTLSTDRDNAPAPPLVRSSSASSHNYQATSTFVPAPDHTRHPPHSSSSYSFQLQQQLNHPPPPRVPPPRFDPNGPSLWAAAESDSEPLPRPGGPTPPPPRSNAARSESVVIVEEESRRERPPQPPPPLQIARRTVVEATEVDPNSIDEYHPYEYSTHCLELDVDVDSDEEPEPEPEPELSVRRAAGEELPTRDFVLVPPPPPNHSPATVISVADDHYDHHHDVELEMMNSSSSSSFAAATGSEGPRRATLIQPGDPSRTSGGRGGGRGGGGGGGFQGTAQRAIGRGGVGGGGTRHKQFKTAGGGGKTRNDFNNDEDEEDDKNRQRKGKGPASGAIGPAVVVGAGSKLFSMAVGASNSTTNRAKGGKSVSNGVVATKATIQSMSKIPKRGSAPSRVIPQDQEPTQAEQAAQMVERDLLKRAQEEGRAHRVGQNHSLAIKGASGKGKGKAKEEEITLSSSDDDDDNCDDPIQDPDQDDDDDDDLGRPMHAGPSNSRPTTAVKTRPPRNSVVSQGGNGAAPSSPDPLHMVVVMPPQPVRKNGAAAGTTAPGNVSRRIQQYESNTASNPPAKKVATSLAPRNAKAPPPSLDGAGNQDDWYVSTKQGPTVPPKRKNKKKDASPSTAGIGIPPVIDLAVKPYLLARHAIPPSPSGGVDDRSSNAFNLKLTLGSAGANSSKSHKMTVTRSSGGDDDEVVAFKVDEVQRIEWFILPGDGSNAISFTFKTLSKERIMTKLGEDWLTFQECEVDNEVFFVSKGQKIDNLENWKTSPGTAFEQMLYCLAKSSCELVHVGESRSKMHEQLYAHAEEQSTALGRLTERGKPGGKKVIKTAPMQQQLNFAGQAASSRGSIPTPSFYGSGSGSARAGQQDAQGDWVEGEQQQQQQQTHSGQAPRRSARASTSIYKEGAPRRPPPAPDPYPSDHVVLEYPQGEPGSITVTYGDKKRLNDDEFLNDTLIELGLKKAMGDVKKADETRRDEDKIAPLVHVFNSFFYKKLSSGKQLKEDKDVGIFTPYYLVQKWTKKFNFFDKKYVIIPINEHLHWYLAVIVNPKWIIDAAERYPPPNPSKAEPRAHATRGRTSTAADSISLESSSQPELGTGAIVASAAADAGTEIAETPQVPVERKSKYFAGKAGPGRALQPENSEEILDRQHERQEAMIHAKLQEAGVDTEMGLEEEEDADDSDVVMHDPHVEGGGSNGKPTSETLELSDDDEVNAPPVVAAGISGSTDASASTKPPSGRAPVPIGAPTAPPKGASSPPPESAAQEYPRSKEGEDVEVEEPVPTAAELAQQLGADPSLADRCWIFTFDSLGGSHGAVVEKLKKYLDMEAKTKLMKQWTASHVVQGIAVNVPQQPNFCDCGLYILHYVEKFLADPAKMTEYIVSREPGPPKLPKGPSAEAKQKRAAYKKLDDKFKAAVARENAWNEAEAVNKRKTMRAEVESLMEAYKPYRAERDAREAEEKRKRDEKREARDKREAEEVAPGAATRKKPERIEKKQAVEASAGPATAAVKRGPGRPKKKPEEINLCETTDEEEEEDEQPVAGSPEKGSARTTASHARSSPKRRRAETPVPVVASASTTQLHGTSADFLPDSQPLRPPSRALTRHESSSDSRDDEILTQREESGDLDNTQEEEDVPSKRSLPSSASPRSPPSRKKKRQAPPSSAQHASEPILQGTSQEPAQDEDEEQDQLDSSIEIRARASPVLELPPPNQERLAAAAAGDDDEEIGNVGETSKPASGSSSSTTSAKSHKRKRSVNGNGSSTANSPRRPPPAMKNSNGAARETIQIDD